MGISAAEPATQTCFACLAPYALSTGLVRTCVACKAFMTQGVICIGVTDDAPMPSVGPPAASSVDLNPYRDGNFCVITRERCEELSKSRSFGWTNKWRFVTATEWARLGLPRHGKSGASQTRKGKYLEQVED